MSNPNEKQFEKQCTKRSGKQQEKLLGKQRKKQIVKLSSRRTNCERCQNNSKSKKIEETRLTNAAGKNCNKCKWKIVVASAAIQFSFTLQIISVRY